MEQYTYIHITSHHYSWSGVRWYSYISTLVYKSKNYLHKTVPNKYFGAILINSYIERATAIIYTPHDSHRREHRALFSKQTWRYTSRHSCNRFLEMSVGPLIKKLCHQKSNHIDIHLNTEHNWDETSFKLTLTACYLANFQSIHLQSFFCPWRHRYAKRYLPKMDTDPNLIQVL